MLNHSKPKTDTKEVIAEILEAKRLLEIEMFQYISSKVRDFNIQSDIAYIKGIDICFANVTTIESCNREFIMATLNIDLERI